MDAVYTTEALSTGAGRDGRSVGHPRQHRSQRWCCTGLILTPSLLAPCYSIAVVRGFFSLSTGRILPHVAHGSSLYPYSETQKSNK